MWSKILTIVLFDPILILLTAKDLHSLFLLLNLLSTWLGFEKGEGGKGSGSAANEGHPRQIILLLAYPVVWKTGEYQKIPIPSASCEVGLCVLRALMKTSRSGPAPIRVARTGRELPRGTTGCSRELAKQHRRVVLHISVMLSGRFPTLSAPPLPH